VAFVILFLFRENLTVGAATAAPAVIPAYFLLGRFFQLEAKEMECFRSKIHVWKVTIG